ncbi:MAG: type IVB secretion system protein IcmF [Legionella sp.]
MDNSLHTLCDTIKKVASQLKPQINQLSFIVVTGKADQGKSALLKQAQLEEAPVFSEQHAKVYFNARGLIVELGEQWLTNSKTLLQTTLKQLNKCSRHLKITGLVLCVDINSLLTLEPGQFVEQRKAHLNLLERWGSNLGYPLELALLFTKMDHLAGFAEFYQVDHTTDLAKPLGFSLESINQAPQKIAAYNEQFNQFIEQLGQQVIHKMHPVRSTVKRSLIREFPLQLASLRAPIQGFIQGISTKQFHLHAIYFTSAEQGGVSVDRLNKKIQHEYALTVQDRFPQAVNFRAYFVEGAVKTIQEQCSQLPQQSSLSQKPLIALAASIAVISLTVLSYQYFKTSTVLDEASKELLAYDNLHSQSNNKAQALYHLTKAAKALDGIKPSTLALPHVHQLKQGLQHNAQNQLQGDFVPSLVQELEQAITNPSNTPIVRYKALKTYLMLSQPEHFSAAAIYDWFKQHWGPEASKTQLTLLQQTLNKPLTQGSTQSQIISDARNYLNALPTSYLYYSIAKEYFPATKHTIDVEGFNLATNDLPLYFTKQGFEQISRDLPRISEQLQAENWVLARQNLDQLHNLLLQAYCFDYVTWWQTFMRKSQPVHYQDYQQGRRITQLLQQSDALSTLIHMIQQETRPDVNETSTVFNQFIATKFTDLNLISQSSTKELATHINELERFISTLSVINDGGKTAFTISKSRFSNDNASDPISQLYNQARQLPEPLNIWAKQIAGDTWVILIRDSKQYINQQWQETVYNDYQQSIAKRYPLDSTQEQEIAIDDFNRFFATHGVLNSFTEHYIKPFLDVSQAEWKPKSVNDFILPMSNETLDELIRANIITNMFFPNHSDKSKIEFSLQKINLDPVVSSLKLQIGDIELMDNQGSESFIHFSWPQNNAILSLDSIEGNHYELAEQGSWAIFKLLEKVNVLIDEQDSSSLQILFEVNSNSGRYLLRTNNSVNPFTPGILNGFVLDKTIV